MTLTATNLSIARGGLPVLEGLSLSLQPGKALILRGPNGSGKTTLLRTLAGLQSPTAGKVTGGEDQIAYAGHSDGLKLTMTVRENLTFWARVFQAGDVVTALSTYDLDSLADRSAGTLSAGQKRRLGLARLMVTGRRIWALDEPTVSLDSAAVTLFANAVLGHLGQGGSALIATHIDLGLDAEVLDVTPHRARMSPLSDPDGAYL
ncbi:MAG: heme ABC exporter ATP-binding protein CcmA [Paracoccaceae bacterium]